MNSGRLEDQALAPSRVPAGLAVHRSPSTYQITDTWKEQNVASVDGSVYTVCFLVGREVQMCAPPVLRPKGFRLSGGAMSDCFSLCLTEKQPHFLAEATTRYSYSRITHYGGRMREKRRVMMPVEVRLLCTCV